MESIRNLNAHSIRPLERNLTAIINPDNLHHAHPGADLDDIHSTAKDLVDEAAIYGKTEGALILNKNRLGMDFRASWATIEKIDGRLSEQCWKTGAKIWTTIAAQHTNTVFIDGDPLHIS